LIENLESYSGENLVRFPSERHQSPGGVISNEVRDLSLNGPPHCDQRGKIRLVCLASDRL
jgi:hypothetical protein